MKEYRIIKQDDDFIVQKKCLWWWNYQKHLIGGGEMPLTSITRFKTLEHAIAAIENIRPKLDSEMVVVEHRIIL